MSPSNVIPEQLDRYLAGTATVSERQAVEVWLAADAARRDLVDALRTRQRYETADTTEAWLARIKVAAAMTKVDRTRDAERISRTGRSRRRTMAELFFVAAILLSVVAGTRFLRRLNKISTPVQRYQTQTGQQATVRLADGSTIVLAPATVMTMTPTDVHVTGEAYFTIVPSPARQLVVHTRNAVIRVLGTTFSVRQYPDEGKSRVVVEDGKVTVQAQLHDGIHSAPTVVTTRMLAQVDSGVSVISGILPREYTGWTQGTLVFDRTPLRDVAVALGRAYGATIRIPDSALAGKTLIAEVEVLQKPLPQVLDFISAAMNAHYVRNDSSFILVPGRHDMDMPREQPHEQPQRNRFPQPEQQYGR